MAPSMSRGTPFVYILELRSGALYIGCAHDLEARLTRHSTGVACRTTALDAPRKILFLEVHVSFAAARRREAQIKRWSRAKKIALIRGDLADLRDLSRSRD